MSAPNTKTLYSLITDSYVSQFHKHRLACLEWPTEDAFVDYELSKLSRRGFLERISDALDELMKEPRHD